MQEKHIGQDNLYIKNSQGPQNTQSNGQFYVFHKTKKYPHVFCESFRMKPPMEAYISNLSGCLEK